MIFDQLCGIAERWIPEILPPLESARIFKFEGIPHQALRQSYTDDELQFFTEFFTLPFPVVAMEDPASCIILFDIHKGAKGLGMKRGFIEAMPADSDLKNYYDGGGETMQKRQAALYGQHAGALMVTLGAISDMTVESSHHFIYHAAGLFGKLVSKKDGVLFDTKDMDQETADTMYRATGSNASTAIQEVMFVNTPNRFVLEEAPALGFKRGKGAPKLKRSGERPVYTLLTPGEIRTKLRIPNPEPGDRATPTPHERRAHRRLYSSDRFVHMKGKSILIAATWIGPSEAVVGQKRYRVRLDI